VSPIYWLSIRLRRVNPAAPSGLDATPDSFRPNQSPLVSSPGPLAFWSRRCRLSATSVASRRPLSPRGSVTCYQTCDTAFAFSRPVSPARVLGVHATPVSFQAESVPPGHQPRSRRFSPECWRVSSGRLPTSLARLSPRGSQDPRGPFDVSHLALRRQPHAQVCMLPLLSRAQQSFLTPSLGQDPDEQRRARVVSCEYA
jgi:hypothetical protein